MALNKIHWYDGWIYDKVIAPYQVRLFRKISALIEPDSKIIDVGCGTGQFSFTVYEKFDTIFGIDLSKKNIDKANFNLSKSNISNISFLHTEVKELLQKKQLHYDYAVMTYVIHEVNESERISLLKDVSEIANKIIIGDYLVPMPKSLTYYMIKIIEFIAGNDHYNSFKTYVKHGGIQYLANETGLKINIEYKFNKSLKHLVVLSK